MAIVFRTPPYRDPDIESSVQVYLQLFRPRDGEYSEPRPFTYKPKDHDLEEVERKRRKISHSYTSIGEMGANSGTNAFIAHSFHGLSESANTQTTRDNNNNNIGYYGENGITCDHLAVTNNCSVLSVTRRPNQLFGRIPETQNLFAK